MPSTFVRVYPPAQPAPGPAYWFPFHHEELLVQQREHGLALVHGGEAIRALLKPQSVLYMGTLDGVPCLTCETNAESEIPEGWSAQGLWSLYGQIDDMAYGLVGYASQLLYWQRTSRYCPVSGHLTETEPGTWGRRCPSCGHVGYPHVTPAILALVHDGDRVLLTHKPGWGGRYSCVAGFVEPGETLEECVQREVYEEIGVEVADVAYMGNQPWPFPHQLMVGFSARYVSGAVRLDEKELDAAAWFHFDNLPELPPPFSLAHYMITSWARRFNKA